MTLKRLIAVLQEIDARADQSEEQLIVMVGHPTNRRVATYADQQDEFVVIHADE